MAVDEALSPRLLEPEIQVNTDLTLQFMRREHIDDLWGILRAAPEIHSYITWTAGVKTPDDIGRAIDERFPQKEEAPYVLKDSRAAIGYVGMRSSPSIEHEYEFGYFLAPHVRGRGYVPAATSSLMAAARDTLGAGSFALYIEDANTASQSVAAKLGFTATDELREDLALGCFERRYERVAPHV